MADSFVIESLTLSGFRAFLKPQTFNFGDRPCLGIFAPNAHGKSSFVDGLEFAFSAGGTLVRLGGKAADNFAGPSALKHNLADEAKVASEVSMTFRNAGLVSSGSRSTTGKRAMPQAFEAVRAGFVVDPIIRGYALRSFVETESAGDRYKAIAEWLELGPLVEVQKNLRALRSLAKAASEDESRFRAVDAALARLTSQAIARWDEAAVLHHLNAALTPLDSKMSLAVLDVADPSYAILKARAADEENRLGLSTLKLLKSLADALHRPAFEDPEAEAAAPAPKIGVFASALAAQDVAEKTEADERGKAEKAVFAKVWEAAQPLFSDGATAPDACPLCDTPLAATTARGAAGLAAHIDQHLADLQAYRAAKKSLDDAEKLVAAARLALSTALSNLAAQELPEALKTALASYQTTLKDGGEPSPAQTSLLRAALLDYSQNLTSQIEAIETRQGEATYGKTLALADSLFELKGQFAQAGRVRQELETLAASLNAQSSHVSKVIRNGLQTLLDVLNTPMNDIYRDIQNDKARPVRLELPPEDETNQQRMQLLIDFAGNREGVPPSGYLSDSQIHSLALAFRLAAILQFNKAVRVVVFDDVVTSYDADHRRAICAMIAKRLGGLQTLVVTHDERFFLYLRDQLEPARWRFTRVTHLEAKHGPRFGDVRIGDAEIQTRWDEGNSAANEMRQAEEEWLLSICRDFEVSVKIRPLERPYSYDRGELATALAAFLKDKKMLPLAIAGVNNPFLNTLASGLVENFGSHFQDNPNAHASVGDEQQRWKEFMAFRSQFACPSCQRTKFKRGQLNKPVCAAAGCETQFSFKAG